MCRDVKKAGISDQIPTMHTNNMKSELLLVLGIATTVSLQYYTDTINGGGPCKEGVPFIGIGRQLHLA